MHKMSEHLHKNVAFKSLIHCYSKLFKALIEILQTFLVWLRTSGGRWPQLSSRAPRPRSVWPTSPWLSWRGGGAPSSGRRTPWLPGTPGRGSGWSCPLTPGPGTRWASAWRATTTSGLWWAAGPGARSPALSSQWTSSRLGARPPAGLSWRGRSHSASVTPRC